MIPLSLILLIIAAVFAVIYAWPVWAAPYAPWRERAYAISYCALVLFICCMYSKGINVHAMLQSIVRAVWLAMLLPIARTAGLA